MQVQVIAERVGHCGVFKMGFLTATYVKNPMRRCFMWIITKDGKELKKGYHECWGCGKREMRQAAAKLLLN